MRRQRTPPSLAAALDNCAVRDGDLSYAILRLFLRQGGDSLTPADRLVTGTGISGCLACCSLPTGGMCNGRVSRQKQSPRDVRVTSPALPRGPLARQSLGQPRVCRPRAARIPVSSGDRPGKLPVIIRITVIRGVDTSLVMVVIGIPNGRLSTAAGLPQRSEMSMPPVFQGTVFHSSSCGGVAASVGGAKSVCAVATRSTKGLTRGRCVSWTLHTHCYRDLNRL